MAAWPPSEVASGRTPVKYGKQKPMRVMVTSWASVHQVPLNNIFSVPHVFMSTKFYVLFVGVLYSVAQ